MKCIKCRVTLYELPLHRTKPLDSVSAGWMCQPCITLEHPELTTDRLIRCHLTAKFYDVGNCLHVDPQNG